jgi:cysteine desulfurase
MVGGGQERGYRPGTLPVPLVVGLGAAAELAGAEHVKRSREARQTKERFLTGLSPVEYKVNGDPARTQAHAVNLSFPGVDSQALMLSLRDVVAISNGSACTSARPAPSHVLKAMGLNDDRIASAVRISWGPAVTEIPSRPIVTAILGIRG